MIKAAFILLFFVSIQASAVNGLHPSTGTFLLFDTPVGNAAFGDVDPVRKEVSFINYLIGREDFEESFFLLKQLNASDPVWSDSLNFLKGWVLYRQQQLQPSAAYLLNVSENSPLFFKARLFGAYNLAHTGSYAQARMLLEKLPAEQGSMPDAMRHLQLGGVALLENDLDRYLVHSNEFSGNFHVMARQERLMDQHFMAMSDRRQASPALAAVLSAMVPGLGRVYAGKPAEGVVSLLYLAAFGFTTYDFYRGAGPESALFIISASFTGIFYAGNIMGSALAARRTNNEFRHEMEQRILFDMHIPLRNAFN